MKRKGVLVKDRAVMGPLGKDQDLGDPRGVPRFRIPDEGFYFTLSHIKQYNINDKLTYNE